MTNDINILMHRFILELDKFDYNIEVDHIKHKTYDNRKSQLRIVNKSKNQMNTELRKDNTSGVKGINWDKKHQQWVVRIGINNKRIFIGRFKDLKDAEKARKDAEEKYHGEWSYDNSMKGDSHEQNRENENINQPA